MNAVTENLSRLIENYFTFIKYQDKWSVNIFQEIINFLNWNKLVNVDVV